MKVEERLLDDASVDSAQRKHGELSAEVQALADENQEIRELKARVDVLTLDCQRWNVHVHLKAGGNPQEGTLTDE